MNNHERIQLLRKNLGFKSREDFANEINIPFATLRAYEQGVIKDIPHSFLVKLSDQFNVNINWLITGEGEMFINRNTNIQKIKSNKGQNAQNVSGNQIFTTGVHATEQAFTQSVQSKKDDDTDVATYNLFLEAYLKAQKNDDIRGLRLYLMEY